MQTTIARAEQASINSALLALKECLRAVVASSAAAAASSSGAVAVAAGESGAAKRSAVPKAVRVPYRNSVLTHLLQRHFAVGSNLLMIATITPSDDETLQRQSINTCNWASLITGDRLASTRSETSSVRRCLTSTQPNYYNRWRFEPFFFSRRRDCAALP